jgi:hypothetical protein
MRATQRMTSLLERAARCFKSGANPFQARWLMENEVTYSECEQLSGLIGAILRGFARSNDRAQTEVLLHAQDGGAPAEMSRVDPDEWRAG